MAAADYYTQVYTMFVGYYGRPPAKSGLDYYADLVDKAGGNLAVVIDDFFKSAESQAFFAGKTVEQQVNQIFQNLFGRDALPAGLNYWTNLINNGTVALSQAAYTIAFNAAAADVAVRDAKVASAMAWVAGLDTTNEILVYGTDSGRSAGRDFLKAVNTSTPATQAAVDAALKAMVDGGTTNPGQTFTLTTGLDNVAGTVGNDVFQGSINTTPNLLGETSTLNSGDIIKGGTGTDTLNVSVIAGAVPLPLPLPLPPVVQMDSVEVVNIRNIGAAVPLSAAAWTGVQQIWNDRSLVAAPVLVTDVQNDLTVGVRGVNAPGNFTGVAFADAVYAASGTAKLALSDAGREVNGVITYANVGMGAMTTAGRVNALTIDANGKNYLALSTFGAALAGGAKGVETLTVTGSGSVNVATGSSLSGGNLLNELTTVNASANTGGLTIELANADVKVTGGSGADVITLSNGAALTNKAGVDLGAGNDSLLSNGSAGVGTSAVLNGGDGVDTIASLLMEVGNRDNIKNFEVMDLAGESRIIDASLFTSSSFQSLAVSAALAGPVTVTKLAGTALNVDVSAVAGANLTASLAGGATGTTDKLNVNFDAKGTGAASLNAIITTGTDTAAINSGGVKGVDVNGIGSVTDTLNTMSSITITGANDFTLMDVTTNAAATTASADVASSLTMIDGSAATGNLVIVAGYADAIAATGFFTTYNALTIKTGTGDDVVSIGGRGTVSTGTGSDTVYVQRLGVSVDVGVDSVVDTVLLANTADFTGAFGPTTRVTTISNMAQNDVINLNAITGAATINDFTTTAGTFGSLETAVNAAIADGTSAVDFINWVDGNTYIVVNGADDTVVKLVGTYDNFTVAAGVITIGA